MAKTTELALGSEKPVKYHQRVVVAVQTVKDSLVAGQIGGTERESRGQRAGIHIADYFQFVQTQRAWWN